MKTPADKRRDSLRAAYLTSMAAHQIKSRGTPWLGLAVVMLSSDNPHISAGARGVLVICEQDTSLGISVAVFHHLEAGCRLGPPVTARNPKFTYVGGIEALL